MIHCGDELTAHAARLQLPRYAPSLVRVAARATRGGRIGQIVIAGEPWRVRVEGPATWQQAALDVRLLINGQRVRILLADLDAIPAIGATAWDTLDAGLRRLYVEYLCADALSDWSSRVGSTIAIESVETVATTLPATGLGAAFRAGASSGAQARALIVVGDDAWSALGALAGVISSGSQPAAAASAALLPLRLRLTLGSVGLSAAALRSLAVGDVIRTDQTSAADGSLPIVARLGSRDLFNARLDAHRLRVTSILDGGVMPHAALDAGLANLDQIELTTTFELGSQPVTLEVLKSLRPGYVFTTKIASEAPTVTIVVDGQMLGQGRLVAVGDSIGVQVTRWVPMAAPSVPSTAGGGANV